MLVVLNVGAITGDRGTAFSPDGKLLACPSDDQLLVWDVALFERNGVLRGHTGYVYDVAISPDGTRIASAAWDGTVRIWDAATQRPIQVLRHEERIVLSVAFSPDGKQVVSLDRGPNYTSRGTVHVREWAAGRRRYTRSTSRDIHGDTRTAFHPDGSLVAVGGQGAAELFDLASDRAGRAFGAVAGSSNDIAFRRDGRELATAQRDATVRLWDLATGAQRGILRGHQGEVFCVQYSPDGKQIASASRDLTVRLWDARTHEQLAVLPLGRIAYGLAFSPNGTRLATACQDNTIRLWDMASREEVVELHGHTDYVHAVAFSPDGTKLVSCSGDHTVRIWDSLPAR
jgi:WD40 repeat protein